MNGQRQNGGGGNNSSVGAAARRHGPAVADTLRTGYWPGRAARFLTRLAARREARAIVVLGLLSVIFAVVAHLVRDNEFRAVDLTVTHTLQRPRRPLLDYAATLFTNAGSGVTYAVVLVLVAVPLLRARRVWAAGLLLAAALAGHPSNFWLKTLFERKRPTAEDLVQVMLPTSGTSFPSGHAQSAVMFYGFLAFLAWVLLHRRRPRRTIVAALVGLIALIGLSRIYVGAHWFSDVLGGWTVGLFCLFLLAEVYKWVGANELSPRDPVPPHPPQ